MSGMTVPLKGNCMRTLLIAAALAAMPAAASADVIGGVFTASGFTLDDPNPPFTNAQGSYSVDFDKSTNTGQLQSFSLDIGNLHYGLSDTNLFTPLSSDGTKTYREFDFTGKNSDTSNSPYINTYANDFHLALVFDPLTLALTTFPDRNGVQTPGILRYTTASTTDDPPNSYGGLWGSTTLSVTPIGSVPEPATWAMMLLGFGFVGAAMRRQRQPNLVRQVMI